MKEYFLGIISFAFFGSFVLSVAPQGLGRKYLRFLCGLCGVGCVMFPLVSLSYGNGAELIRNAFEISEESEENAVEIYNLYLDETIIKNAEKDLKREIISSLSAKDEDFDLEIVLDKNSDEFYIKKIFVTFYPSGYDIDPLKVEKICFFAYKCECEFFYDV